MNWRMHSTEVNQSQRKFLGGVAVKTSCPSMYVHDTKACVLCIFECKCVKCVLVARVSDCRVTNKHRAAVLVPGRKKLGLDPLRAVLRQVLCARYHFLDFQSSLLQHLFLKYVPPASGVVCISTVLVSDLTRSNQTSHVMSWSLAASPLEVSMLAATTSYILRRGSI